MNFPVRYSITSGCRSLPQMSVRPIPAALAVMLLTVEAGAQSGPGETEFSWSSEPLAARVVTPASRASAGEAREAAPQVAQGTLRVREAAGVPVSVIIDGRAVGHAPWSGRVDAGPHEIALEGLNCRSRVHTVVVAAQEDLVVALEAAPTAGMLEIAVIPSNAAIAINGQRVGLGSYRSWLPAGSYVLDIHAPGLGEARTQVSLSAGQTVSKELVLMDKGPTVDDELSDDTRVFHGFVAQFGLLAAQAQHGPADATVTEDSAAAGVPRVAAGAFLRMGSAHGPLSVELTGAFLADTRGESPSRAACVEPTLCVNSAYLSYGLGGMVGIGGHLSTTTQGIRLTAGGSFGAAYRSIRTVEEVTSERLETVSYIAPGAMADAGVLLGSTPGTKVYLGGLLWWERPRSELSIEVPAGDVATTMTVARGNQVYVGPLLALQFGR